MEIKKALRLGICCIFLFSCSFSKFKTKHKCRKIEHMEITGVSVGCGTEKKYRPYWSSIFLNWSKLETKNTTFGYLFFQVNCSGLIYAFSSFLNSIRKKRVPSGDKKVSSGMPLFPFFSFFQHTHPRSRAYARHDLSISVSICFIVLLMFVISCPCLAFRSFEVLLLVRKMIFSAIGTLVYV